MTVNATTNIDPTVDRFAIWQESQQRYTNLNAAWPRFDGGPLEGANPDFKYYKRVDVDQPEVDHRFTLTSVSGRVEAATTPPEGHPAGTYQAEFTVVKRPKEELKLQVESAFQGQLKALFPDSANPAVLLEAADALARKQKNDPLSPAQQAQIDAVLAVGDGVAQLRAMQAEFNAAIEADEDYDLSVWTSV